MNTHPDRKDLPQMGRAKLLLVEDHEHMARMLRRLLEADGFDVQTAGTLGDALALVRGQTFDLVLSDLALPDGDGLDLPKQLGRVPAVALSGHGELEDVRRSLAAGFAAHLIKPVEADVLTAAVQRVLDQRRACAAAPASCA